MIYQTWFLNYWMAVLSNGLLMSSGLIKLYQCYLTFTIVRQLLAWKLTTEYFILSEGQWKSFISTNVKRSFIKQSLRRDLNQRLLEKLAEFFSSLAISFFFLKNIPGGGGRGDNHSASAQAWKKNELPQDFLSCSCQCLPVNKPSSHWVNETLSPLTH